MLRASLSNPGGLWAFVAGNGVQADLGRDQCHAVAV